MKKVISLVLIMTFTLSFLTENGALAWQIGSGSTSSGSNSAQLGQIAESAGAVKAFQADLFTGRAQTGVPIFVPPGRKNVQPSLNLSYSSSGGSGWLGMGWGLDMGFIARDVKRGVPKYDSTDKYIFSFQGVSSELVSVATNEYRAKDEALFLKFVFDPTNNKWTVTDKSGTQHTFGDASGNRQTNGLGTFKWALCKVKDTSGNYMTITYTTDNGELYLSTVEYNGNETQSFAHSHKVEFTLEDRDDDSLSYITGARVETKKRLDYIQVKVKDGGGTYQLARKYTLDYEYSTATKKSRLITVTEYGKDGSTSLPATTFVYNDKPLEFNSMVDISGIVRANTGSSDYDYVRATASSTDTEVDFVDMNGDGLPDRVQAVSGNTGWKLQLNQSQGSSFAALLDFGTLTKPTGSATWDWVSALSSGKKVSDLSDINGDGRPDRVLTQDSNTSWTVQLNNGSGFDSSTTWSGIERMVAGDNSYDHLQYTGGTNSPVWIELMDMNGDGLPDRVMAEETNSTWKVQLNTGTAFATKQSWGTTERMTNYSKRDAIRTLSDVRDVYVDMVDLNGDGLPDRVQSDDDNTNWKVQWNTGNGFTTMENYGPIEKMDASVERSHIRHYKATTGEQTVDLFDINADGLPDRVQAADDNTVWKVQINTGVGFASIENFSGIEKRTSATKYSYPRLFDIVGTQTIDTADIDGDGMTDRIQADASNTVWKVQKNKGPYPDLLKEIKNGRGGKTLVTYGASTAYDNTDSNSKHRLPFPIQVVTQVDQQDGMGNTYTTTYSYKGGMFDSTNREFRGFREVTATDAVGTKTISTFGQTDTLKGKLLTKEVRDSSNNLFSKEETTWSSSNPYTGVNFVYVSQQDNYIYDGDASYKQTRQEFTYDSYGNLASVIERGDTGVSGDERKTVNEYNTNSTPYIMNTLKKTTLYDSDLTTIKAERYFYYDGASSISTAPTAGLLTKEEEWLNTASDCSTAEPCANNPKTTMTYDSYGNVATVIDARGKTTTNAYDATYHLFLTEIKNALWTSEEDPDHKRTFTYDPWLAQILTSTDQNGQITETQYDTLGRVIKVIAPLDDSTNPTQDFEYTDPNLGTCGTTCVTRVRTRVKSSAPGETAAYLTTYSFTDGLGREIQRRSPAEDGSKQIVSGIVEFNSRGLVSKQYTPYFETNDGTIDDYETPITSGAKATFTYDAVGRRTRIDYPDSTNSQVSFSDFVKTTTDQRGKQLRYTNDAYGRLVTVEEFNSGSTYTTTYEYDVLNNLKKTTDNAANQTTITYDSLSRKTGMVDPDMGTWSYTYDLNDNLLTQTDAKSQTISFTYDDLNRVTLKDLPGGGETDVVYTYDSEPDTLADNDVPGDANYRNGRLTKVADASGTHSFAYDEQGRVIMDRKIVSGNTYDFIRTYDSMGRVRTLKYPYPDEELVEYSYNGFGDVEMIRGCASGNPWASCSAPDKTDYIKDVNYNASGQITYTKYGNNVTSDYTYDSDTLRLENILTKKPDGNTELQDLSYTFDNNGNVSAIADGVNSMSQSFTYDDLNRLTRAEGSAYGGSSNPQIFVYDSIGNMTSKGKGNTGGSLTMTYGEGAPGPHAVTSLAWTGSNVPTFCRDYASGACALGYDANGNMTTRGGDALTYDSENRLIEMKTREGDSGSTNYTLKAGWNVIAFTHLPDNRSVSNVLSSLTFGTDYDQVSTWDEVTDTWKHWVNDPDFNDFTAFEHGKTYEIYNKSGTDKSLTVTGLTRGSDISHSIVSGDNFISPAVKTATNITTVLSSLTQGTDYSHVERFNATTQTWESSPASFTQFEPGKGYIIVGLTSANFSYGKNETTTTFVYDSTGARVKKTAGATTTIYLGKDYDIVGSLTTKYIFLGDRRVALKDSSDTKLYFHEDHINSSNVITDSSGNSAALYEYDPYGSTVTHTGASDVKHQFTGQEKDDSTGLHYYNARYYDSQLGRFITSDPTVQNPGDPQDLNRYAYARNNPINFTDPTGFGFFKKLIAAIVGVVVGVLTTIATGNPMLGFAAGVAAYRATEAALNGEKLRNVINAGINGFTEGFEIYNGLSNPMNLLTNGPDTSQASAGQLVKTGLMTFGVDPMVADKIGSQIESVVSNKENLKMWGEIILGTFWEPADRAFAARDWLKGDFHWTDLIGIMPGITHGQVRGIRKIVIGETSGRVAEYARKIGAEWFTPSVRGFKEQMKENRKWLFDKMRKGYEIHDIKLDPQRLDRGPFYQMESRAVRRTNYPVTEVKGVE
jgi:RHS repeat-associated protein